MLQADETVYFAFTYPYTYTQMLSRLDQLAEKASACEELYMHNEVLTKSPEGRQINLLTISSRRGLLQSTDPPLPFNPAATARANQFEGKQVVFVSARVHPGEVAGCCMPNAVCRMLYANASRRGGWMASWSLRGVEGAGAVGAGWVAPIRDAPDRSPFHCAVLGGPVCSAVSAVSVVVAVGAG